MSRARRRKPAPFRHLASLLLLTLIGCGSGGGCSSCSGITPLAGGFDTHKAVENAGAARVTAKGYQWINDPANLSAIVSNLFGAAGGELSFPINDSGDQDVGGGVHYQLCPGGPHDDLCKVRIDFANANLSIAPDMPHEIKISGSLPVHLNLPVKLTETFGPFPDASCDATIAIDGDGSCDSGVTLDSFYPEQLNVDISIEVDQAQGHARYGYTRIHIADVSIDPDQLNNSLNICNCSVISSIADNDTIKGWVIDAFLPTVIGYLKSSVEDQLCQKADPNVTPSCPVGTTDVDGTCRYGTDANADCVSLLLGTDGHANLGSLLASISPGTSGGLDFLFAAGGVDTNPDGLAWGDGDPKNGGTTIGLLGGAEPNPISKCVKISDLARPNGLPIPMGLYQEDIPNWPAGMTGPHIGVSVSEDYMNYALAGAYNSGLLCLGITSENVPQLNSGLLTVLLPSLSGLALQGEPQQVGIVVRPGTPPRVAVGNGTNTDTDPILHVFLDKASFDFYIFSTDRFIRFMTATYDLDVPVNLTVSADGLGPVVGKVGVKNGVVTNSSLLGESPTDIANLVGGLINTAVDQALGGGIAPIDYNSALSTLGIKLYIPESVDGQGSPGLRKLTEGSHNYLGVFASFMLGGSPAAGHQTETSATLLDKRVDPAGLFYKTVTADNAPVVRLALATGETSQQVEYATRVDTGFWRPWTKQRVVEVQDEVLRIQGRHTIQVRSRLAGMGLTTDATPASVSFLIDATPPTVKITDKGNGVALISATDLVSDEAHVLVRTRIDGGSWSEWKPANEVQQIAIDAKLHALDVEAKDEEGNVGKAQQALLRGRADAAAGCGCEVAGNGGGSRGAAWLFAVGVAALFARAARRRRAAPAPQSTTNTVSRSFRAFTALATLSVAFSWAGCSCGDESSVAGSSGHHPTGGNPDDCKEPDCKTLEPGLVGAYTSAASQGDTLWVSGYAEANAEQGYKWGDLVVGKWNDKTGKVDWKAIDGVPEQDVDPKKYDVDGFRGGVTDAGDDVGIWTSLALDAAGNPSVAYYDRTHHALKFAQFNGKTWSIHTVDQGASAEVGRYAKLVNLNGHWVIAYQWLGAGGDMGAAVSHVRIATSSSGAPTAGSWAFEDAATDKESPCRAQFCSGSQQCRASTGRCTTPDTGCSPACASGEACFQGACEAVFGATQVDSYPDAIGGYITIAPTGDGNVGVAWYDRTHGNLWAAAKQGGAWKAHLIDGEAPNGTNTSDVGVGAALFIDNAGGWHITYVDGLTEELKYVRLNAMLGVVEGPEIIDDGVTLNGQTNADGQHLVGDDSSLVVTSSGEVHVSYQDATAGTLRYARGVPGATKHTWTVKVVQQDGFAGAFSKVITLNGSERVLNWWRKGGFYATGDVAVITP